MLSKPENYERDSLGWALYALKTEHDYNARGSGRQHPDERLVIHGEILNVQIGQHPDERFVSHEEMINVQNPEAKLSRFKEFVEARRAFHQAALRSTFNRQDPLALREPLASDLNRVMSRFIDWYQIRDLEQRNAASSQDEAFIRQFLDGNGLRAGLILRPELDYICWLHLITPIRSEWKWQLRDIALAVLKTFPSDDYRRQVHRLFRSPPDKLTFEPADLGDTNPEAVAKGLPEELSELRDDWVSEKITEIGPFADNLRKQLASAGINTTGRTGRPKGAAPQTGSDEMAENQTPTEDFLRAIKDANDLQFADPDLEKDEPKAWLLAKRLMA
jgi:hypothetical protein